MKVGSLFSGIGGFDLGLERAGMQVVWQSEIEPYCCEVLKKHWPEVPNLGDIFKIKDPPAVDLICGGFPCQPFSVAGKRKGKADDRYLWPEMLRVVTEVKPRWIFAENVPGIIHMELDQVLSDLEGEGYETGTLIIPACALNAPHRRDRIWIIGYSKCGGGTRLRAVGEIQEGAYPDSNGSSTDASYPSGTGAGNQGGETSNEGRRASEGGRTGIRQEDGETGSGRATPTDRHAPDTEPRGLSSMRAEGSEGQSSQGSQSTGYVEAENWSWDIPWPEVATNLLRMDDGISSGLHLYLQGVDNAPTIKSLSRQNLQELWDNLQQKEVSERMGGLWQVPQEGTLLPILCELERRTDGSDYLSPSGESLSNGFLRPVWYEGKSRSSSHQWRHSGEHRRKHADLVSSVPYEVALEIKEAWDCVSHLQDAIRGNRVKRLKALGNAIVPQIAEKIGRMILEIDF